MENAVVSTQTRTCPHPRLTTLQCLSSISDKEHNSKHGLQIPVLPSLCGAFCSEIIQMDGFMATEHSTAVDIIYNTRRNCSETGGIMETSSV